jgi:hypothetical protein
MRKWIVTLINLVFLAGWQWLAEWALGTPFTLQGYTLSVAVYALLTANGKEDRT